MITKERIREIVKEVVGYHGSPVYKTFGKFKKSKHGYLGPGIYFTDLKERARKYADKLYGPHSGKIYEVEIDIKNPLIITTGDGTRELLYTIYGSDKVYEKRKESQSMESWLVSPSDIKRLYNKGYDGVIWKVGGESEIVVYNAEQIKIIDVYLS